jgi:hypothetical protein
MWAARELPSWQPGLLAANPAWWGTYADHFCQTSSAGSSGHILWAVLTSPSIPCANGAWLVHQARCAQICMVASSLVMLVQWRSKLGRVCRRVS